MTDIVKVEPYKVPTLKDLLSADNKALMERKDELNILLNKPTPRKWVKKHPFVNIDVLQTNGTKAKQPLEYIPVERTKLLLTQIFGGYNDRITGVYQLFNSVCVTLELTVIDPITGKEIKHDGIGAVGVQTDKGSNASDMGAIKQDAVTKAAPAAASYALKNAAEKLGSLFGGALQKYDLEGFTPFYNEKAKKALTQKLEARYDNGTETNS